MVGEIKARETVNLDGERDARLKSRSFPSVRLRTRLDSTLFHESSAFRALVHACWSAPVLPQGSAPNSERG